MSTQEQQAAAQHDLERRAYKALLVLAKTPTRSILDKMPWRLCGDIERFEEHRSQDPK